MKKLPLASKIFIALVLGIIAGLSMQGHANITVDYIKPFGIIFLNLIKFIVVPVVLFSIMEGILSMKDMKKVGKIGIRSVIFYLTTTLFAISIGLLFAMAFKGFFPTLEVSSLTYAAPQKTNIMETIVGIFPNNVIVPLHSAIMLQVIVMAILISFAILKLGEKVKIVSEGISALSAVFVKCMDMILQLSPIGVFCLICPVIATNGVAVIGSFAKVILVAYLAFLLHAVLVYSSIVKIFGGIGPKTFFKEMIPAMMFAFSSASSVGTLPINMKCTEKMGASREIGSFVLPLGATINMDGTAIYQGVCAIFIAACYGIDLTVGQMVTIVITATLASIGTAGVPGAGVVMLAMVLTSVGLPVDGIALVAGVDRIFDMGRTVLNITGDAACTVVMSKMNNKLTQN